MVNIPVTLPIEVEDEPATEEFLRDFFEETPNHKSTASLKTSTPILSTQPLTEKPESIILSKLPTSPSTSSSTSSSSTTSTSFSSPSSSSAASNSGLSDISNISLLSAKVNYNKSIYEPK